MPGPPNRPDFFGHMLADAVKDGSVPEAKVTEKAVRIVYSMAASGVLDANNTGTAAANVSTPAAVALARQLSRESATLLTNAKGTLPLSRTPTVAIIGAAGRASVGAIFGGSGSGKVVPANPVGIYEAFAARPASSAVGGGCTAVAPSYSDGFNVAEAVALAKQAQVVIVVLAQTSSEGKDRATLELNQSDVAAAVIAAQPNTVVVTISPGPFL